MAHMVAIPNELVLPLKSPPYHDPNTGFVFLTITLRDDVLEWLRQHVKHAVGIEGQKDCETYETLVLTFEDLGEATHFKLRWF